MTPNRNHTDMRRTADRALLAFFTVLSAAAVTAGICTGTWHNILFGVMYIAIYKSIKIK